MLRRDFNHKLVQENMKQVELDYVAKAAVKNFADRLAEARKRDALSLLAQLKGQYSIEAMTDTLLDKLSEVGYKEAVEFYRQRVAEGS